MPSYVTCPVCRVPIHKCGCRLPKVSSAQAPVENRGASKLVGTGESVSWRKACACKSASATNRFITEHRIDPVTHAFLVVTTFLPMPSCCECNTPWTMTEPANKELSNSAPQKITMSNTRLPSLPPTSTAAAKVRGAELRSSGGFGVCVEIAAQCYGYVACSKIARKDKAVIELAEDLRASREMQKLLGARALLQQMLDVAENADETGYVADVGFVDLDKLHAEVRAAL